MSVVAVGKVGGSKGEGGEEDEGEGEGEGAYETGEDEEDEEERDDCDIRESVESMKYEECLKWDFK